MPMNFVTMTSAAASCRPNLKTPFLEFLRLTVLMAVAVWLATPLYAQGTGMIEGRVFDAGRGEYLENARLTIAGTNLEAFTDAAGHYRFTQVPGTVANLTVSFTGLTPQAETVTVSPGQAVRRDITLRADSPLVKMSEFIAILCTATDPTPPAPITKILLTVNLLKDAPLRAHGGGI